MKTKEWIFSMDTQQDDSSPEDYFLSVATKGSAPAKEQGGQQVFDICEAL